MRRPPLTMADIRTARWAKSSNGRLLPLNSKAWRDLRRLVLSENPLCQYCPPGVLTVATEVDHRDNNPANNTRDNLVATCKSCHSLKTMADMHGREARMGCDSEGNPINPAHPWNKAHHEAARGLAEPFGAGNHGEPPAPNRLDATA